MALAIVFRAPLVARVEGILDHDQSVVGLMALDIAEGRRWPIFFDGQRYMGAVEAYLAAGFVAVLGHSPRVVALAPLVAFGVFAGGQYALWRRWKDRATGHLAAMITVVGSPMLALWSIVPRGGYIELLAWALPVLGLYRKVIQPDGGIRSRFGEFGWGFLLAVGYFLNPLSIVVYLTMALDWTFGRHGADLRRERRLGEWIDSRWAPAAWGLGALVWLGALAGCCHVDFGSGREDSPFVFAMGALPGRWGMMIGAIGVAGLLGGLVLWSGAGRRVALTVAGRPWFAMGSLLAFLPSLAYALLVKAGVLPRDLSLPIWLRAPWDIADNIRDGRGALGTLVGCDPGASATVLMGQGVEFPALAWPNMADWLARASPWVVLMVMALVTSAAWRDRRAWGRLARLQGRDPSPPTVLAMIGLAVMAGLYLLQATSLNASSIRYLVPAWIVLPGLLASAIRGLDRRIRVPATCLLLVPWAIAQVSLWADLDRPSPARPLARELERRGVVAIVAQTPAALMVANLSAGRVGAIEYRPPWPRLRDRYASRFVAGQPIVCVVDLDFPWPTGGSFGWPPSHDLGKALHALAARYPGQVWQAWRVGRYAVWEVDRPLAEILGGDSIPLPPDATSAMVAGARRVDPDASGVLPP
jgi:hypothetical protein